MSQWQQITDEELQIRECHRQNEVARRIQRQFHTKLAASYLRMMGCPLQEAVRILATKRK